MKHLSTILNVVLLIAVAILYYLHFTSKADSANEEIVAVPSTARGAAIAFVNTDTLWKQYEFVKDSKTKLEALDKQLQNQYAARINSFQNEYSNLEKEFNEYLQKGASMTLDQQKAREAELSQKKLQLEQKQRQIMELDKELSAKLVEEEQKMNAELQDTILSFMKRFNKKHSFTYILGYSKGGGILFANDSLDITKAVVSGLNSEYSKIKSKKEKGNE